MNQVLTGIPAGKQAIATGPAHVWDTPRRMVQNISELMEVQPREIFVTENLSHAGWCGGKKIIPNLKDFAAIVTETGGVASHPAILAREHDVPCIVGASNATKVLKTGVTYTVDGIAGVVYEGENGHVFESENERLQNEVRIVNQRVDSLERLLRWHIRQTPGGRSQE